MSTWHHVLVWKHATLLTPPLPAPYRPRQKRVRFSDAGPQVHEYEVEPKRRALDPMEQLEGGLGVAQHGFGARSYVPRPVPPACAASPLGGPFAASAPIQLPLHHNCCAPPTRCPLQARSARYA